MANYELLINCSPKIGYTVVAYYVNGVQLGPEDVPSTLRAQEGKLKELVEGLKGKSKKISLIVSD